jgi:hypothetical protein
MKPEAVRMRRWLADPANRARVRQRERLKRQEPDVKRKMVEYARKWQKKNAARYAVYQKIRNKKRWEMADRDAVNLAKREYALQLKLKVFALLGGQCRCGFSDHRALQLDHTIPIGTKKRRQQISGGAGAFYRRILKDPALRETLQLLCANCNWIKRYENNEHKQWIETTGP